MILAWPCPSLAESKMHDQLTDSGSLRVFSSIGDGHGIRTGRYGAGEKGDGFLRVQMKECR